MPKFSIEEHEKRMREILQDQERTENPLAERLRQVLRRRRLQTLKPPTNLERVE